MSKLNGGNFYIDLSDKVLVPYVSNFPFDNTIIGDFKTLENNLFSIIDKKCVNVKLRFTGDDGYPYFRLYLCDFDGITSRLYKQFYIDNTLCVLDISINNDSINVKVDVA